MLLRVGAVLTAIFTLVLNSCQTVNVTKNGTGDLTIVQNNHGTAIGRDFINAPGVDEFARSSSYSRSRYQRESSTPRCSPERPCSHQDELYFRREAACREMERRIPAPPRPVYQDDCRGCRRGHLTRIYYDNCENPVGISGRPLNGRSELVSRGEWTNGSW